MQLQKEQEFLQLRGTRSFTTSNSHPNQHTAYWIEQRLLLAFSTCLATLSFGENKPEASVRLQHCQWFWDLHSLAIKGTPAAMSPLWGQSKELKPLNVTSSPGSSPLIPFTALAVTGGCKRSCLAGTLPCSLRSQAEGLLLDLCTINCLLIGGRRICRNNLYLSSHAQLKAEPGVPGRAPEPFL